MDWGALDAVILDLDGVMTDTASLHQRAWKRAFDAFLASRPKTQPFADEDYRRYVDGKPRAEGIESFLASRGLSLPLGTQEDPPLAPTVWGLGNHKNALFHQLLQEEGAQVYPSSVDFVRAVRQSGRKTALVSSSRNARSIAQRANILELFDVVLDGEESQRLGLSGKPQPDTFLEAARRLAVVPQCAAVVEDALAGVEAACRGQFGYVIALDRTGQNQALKRAGADAVAPDLEALPFPPDRCPLEEAGPASELEWNLVYHRYDPEKERLREALCTLGNGYFATRGAAPESDAQPHHYPGTYLAGGYDRARTEIAGRVVENEDLVNLPNWLALKFRFPDQGWMSLDELEVLDYRQTLAMRQGLLSRAFRLRDPQGRVLKVEERRLVHMRQPHLAALETTFEAENFHGKLEVRSGLDGRVVNGGVARYRALTAVHLDPVASQVVGEDLLFLKVQTRQSKVRVAQAARTRVLKGGRPLLVPRQNTEEPGFVAQSLWLELRPQVPLTVEKSVALYTSRDNAVSECGLAALQAMRSVHSFDQLLEEHRTTWRHLWRRFDIELFGHRTDSLQCAELTLRLHIFHLLQTASPNTMDLDVGVPARGLHGEAYRGHVFWDELFIFPFLNWRVPEITRSLLRYRFRRLPAARAAARAEGYRGAMFPWQSGSDGREETQILHLNPRSGRWLPDTTHLQRHVNSAIAYNVWQYFQVTGDMEFLAYSGAEMLLEIARFWASISRFQPTSSRYEIHGVMGPDEYHDRLPGADRLGLDNNAYTNVMAVWVLCRALEVLRVLPASRAGELKESLRLRPEELAQWEDISRRMRVAFHQDGIISQFEGYGELAEFDWEGYHQRYGDIHRLDRILEAEGGSTNAFKVSKQADVLMLFYLLSEQELRTLFTRLDYPFDPDAILRNNRYYLQRTAHGSTLSRVVHSWTLARVNRPQSWALFTEALQSDISDVQGGTTPEGIHLGAMSGTVDLVQRAYTGIVTDGEMLRFDPRLPEEVSALHLHVHYRGQSLNVHITRRFLRVEARAGRAPPIQIAVGAVQDRLQPGEHRVFALTE